MRVGPFGSAKQPLLRAASGCGPGRAVGRIHSQHLLSDKQICDVWEEEVAQLICKKIRQHVKLFLDQEAGVNWNSGLRALFQGRSLFV